MTPKPGPPKKPRAPKAAGTEASVTVDASQSALIRSDVVARLRNMLGADGAGDPLPEGRTGVRPIVLSLDPVLHAYFEDEAARRNQLIATGRFTTKSSVHGLLLEALRFRVPDVQLYRAAAAMVSRRRAALGLHPVTVRTPLPLHRDLDLLALSIPGGRAMAVKSVGEALALIWAISVNVENLMPMKEENLDASHARRSDGLAPRAERAGSGRKS